MNDIVMSFVCVSCDPLSVHAIFRRTEGKRQYRLTLCAGDQGESYGEPGPPGHKGPPGDNGSQRESGL